MTSHGSVSVSLEDWLAENRYTKVLFRGIFRADYLHAQLAQGPVPYTNRCDFGFGQYYTDSYEVARRFAGAGGVICIHDWEDEAGDLGVKSITSDEWKETVKMFVSSRNPSLPPRPPPRFTEDFWEGFMSGDHGPIFRCMTPTPTAIYQIAAKTSRAYEYMARRLIGVVYI